MPECNDCLVYLILWVCSMFGCLGSLVYIDSKYDKLKKKQDKIEFENTIKNIVISALKEIENKGE